MSKTILTGMVILFLILCIGGCITTSYYSQGRRSMKYEDWETAIEYFELARTKNPEDPRIRRELGIVYYQKDDLNQAIPHLLEAFIMDSTDGRTLFYLGTAYEVIRDYRHAIDIYNRYVNISPFDDVKISVEARLVRLTRLQMEEDAKQALAGEEEIDVASIPEGTIAVLYFKNIGKKRDLNPIQKGLADMLITSKIIHSKDQQ